MGFLSRFESIYELQGKPGQARNLAMEGVRGLAVILVFFVHFHAIFSGLAPFNSLTQQISYLLGNMGHSGVDLFFALSGYLIYGAVIHKPIVYFKFMRRRVERIYPTFLCLFAVYIALSFVIPGENKIPQAPLDAAIYMLQNLFLLPGMFEIKPLISVAWSLSYEIFYYLFLPFLVRAFRLRELTPKMRILFFYGLAVFYSIYCEYSAHPRLHLILFISGIILYEIIQILKTSAKKFPTPFIETVSLISLFATLYFAHAISEKLPNVQFLPYIERLSGFYRVVLEFHFFCFFLLVSFKSASSVNLFFKNKFMRYLGNMSYSYYLVHGLALKILGFLLIRKLAPASFSGLSYAALLIAAFAFTWVVSTLLFVCVEKPFSLKRVS